ncbi:hypothetical protein U3516DRAFT_208888 [Neocallimastix sp. 'constans']
MNNEDNSKSNTNDLPNNISDSNNPVKKDENEANSQLNKSKTVTSDENTGGDSKSRDITGLEYDESRSERIMARRLRIENNKNNNLKPKNMNNVLIKNKNDTNDVTGKSKQQTQKSRKYIESTKWKDSEMVTNIRVNILTREAARRAEEFLKSKQWVKKKDEEEKVSNDLSNQINKQWEKIFETKGPFKLYNV